MQQQQSFDQPQSSSNNNAASSSGDKKKIGHREVKHGVVHYKKVSSDELKKSIQFGIVQFISESNGQASKYNIDRDLLMQDFQVVETIVFPKNGSATTVAHNFNDFRLKVYAPYGFKYLRKRLIGINDADFMRTIGETDLKDVSNPGASGSVFYKTSDDKFILKTVQHQEAEFLKTLLAGYAFNLLQNLMNNKNTFLPRIYGLFCYQKTELTSMLSDKTNIRIVIMNNILPSDVIIHEKYDLKGSLYKRKASKQERSKTSPTYKDLDFLEEHKGGIKLDEKNYDSLISNLRRDCLILQSFGIMDYSLLLGIHNIEKESKTGNNGHLEAYYEEQLTNNEPTQQQQQQQSHTMNVQNNNKDSYGLSTKSQTLGPNAYNSNRHAENLFKVCAIPARSAKNERLLLYIGIIDILQCYRLKKRLEHTFKSIITDGTQISVCHPNYYAQRFMDFVEKKVFKRDTLKPSPTRKRPTIKNNNLNKTTDDQIIQNNNKNKQNRSFTTTTTTSSTIPTIVNFNRNKKQYQIPDDAQAALDNYNDETEDEDERDSGININVNTLEKNINKRLDRLSSTPLQQQQQQSVTKIVRKYNNNNNDDETNKLSSTTLPTNMKLINSVNSSYNEIRTSINNNNNDNNNKFKVQYHKLIHLSSYSNGVESTSAAEATTTTQIETTDKQTVPNNNFQINFDLYKFPKVQSPKK